MDKARIAELTQWRAEASAALEAGKKELAELQKILKQNEQRLQLFEELLALEGASLEPTRSARESDNLLDICETIMTSNGRPMHIRELHEELLARGVPIPGRGTEANLIVRLQRSEGRFVRVGRGMYAPKELKLPEVKPVRTKRRSAQARRAGGQ